MAGLERTDCIGGLAVPEARVLGNAPHFKINMYCVRNCFSVMVAVSCFL